VSNIFLLTGGCYVSGAEAAMRRPRLDKSVFLFA